MVEKKERKLLKQRKAELLKQQKAALQAQIARRKLLQAVTSQKKVSVLRRVEPRPPSVFIKEEPKKEKPMFLGKSIVL